MDHSRDAIAIVGIAYRLPAGDGRHGESQQLLLVDVACAALEDARLRADAVCGSNTGVYVGVVGADPSDGGGAVESLFAGRLSRTFDLHGPSRTVNASAASLVTVHFACRDLIDGVTDLAIAGLANGVLTTTTHEARLVAAASRLEGFDVAPGGEGIGLVVLKRLTDALRDGDPVQAVISSSNPDVPISELDTQAPLEIAAWRPFDAAAAAQQSEAFCVIGDEARPLATALSRRGARMLRDLDPLEPGPVHVVVALGRFEVKGRHSRLARLEQLLAHAARRPHTRVTLVVRGAYAVIVGDFVHAGQAALAAVARAWMHKQPGLGVRVVDAGEGSLAVDALTQALLDGWTGQESALRRGALLPYAH